MAGSGTAALREGDALLRVEDLHVEYPLTRGKVAHAVSGLSFDVREGETLGLVGESGCGKSTTARAILQLPPPTRGSVRFDGVDLTGLAGRRLRRVRQRLQVIQQDPVSALNPRRRVRDIVAEGLRVWGERAASARVTEMLDAVGLDATAVGDRRPGQFSGGQCQRISIARALVLEPKLLICDEPVSALDVSVQAQILNLIEDLKEKYGITVLFVSHDLGVIKVVSDRVMVLYLGKVCEIGPTQSLYSRPAHPYTRMLLESVPVPDPEVAPGPVPAARELPSVVDPPSGCRFRTRCPLATERCAAEEPQLRESAPGHFVACHHAGES
ncbi:ABC transporter ATP-binding protein [Amycolatopsis sp. 3B14]|uniref:ABC transporter ATP-binding protein n=1 Tax=Amycolatopsis sp. 3B14 TaxID=3243600 RepID=UPI003D99A1F4